MITSATLDDYKVDFLREEKIAEHALAWRTASGHRNAPFFNIVVFVLVVLAKKTRLPFRIEFFDAKEGEKPAYVSFNPRVLHADREIWRLAEIGDPEARFIIAHEVGHLLLHNHHAKAFSSDPSMQIRFAENEYSAEWQANTFAYYFLLPTHLVLAFDTAEDLSRACAVPYAVALERFSAVEAMHRPRKCDLCPTCGHFTVLRDGRCISSICTSANKQP